MDINISLDQKDIENAIQAYVVSNKLNFGQDNIKVVLVAGKGKAGITATIAVSPEALTQVPQKTVKKVIGATEIDVVKTQAERDAAAFEETPEEPTVEKESEPEVKAETQAEPETAINADNPFAETAEEAAAEEPVNNAPAEVADNPFAEENTQATDTLVEQEAPVSQDAAVPDELFAVDE